MAKAIEIEIGDKIVDELTPLSRRRFNAKSDWASIIAGCGVDMSSRFRRVCFWNMENGFFQNNYES